MAQVSVTSVPSEIRPDATLKTGFASVLSRGVKVMVTTGSGLSNVKARVSLPSAIRVLSASNALTRIV